MQHFIYQIKRIICKKGNVFWTLLFPVFLGGLFYAMFSNITKLEKFQEIPVGLITGEASEGLKTVMNGITTDDGSNMFQITIYADEEKAKDALEAEDICGYVDGTKDHKLVLKKSGIEASVLQVFLDQYKQNAALITEVMKNNPEKGAELIANLSKDTQNVLESVNLKGTDKDPYSQYFYALLALTCLIMSSVAMNEGVYLQADQTAVGARRNVSPAKKMSIVVCDFLAIFTTCCVLATIVLAICVYGYGKNFGHQTGLVLLGTYAGCFLAVSVGLTIAVLGKGSMQKKDGICVTFFMVSSFLAGLQWGGITAILEKKCPIVNRLNPATLIVNAFKSLAVFGDTRQYLVNLITLVVMGCIFLAISITKLRRTRYANL